MFRLYIQKDSKKHLAMPVSESVASGTQHCLAGFASHKKEGSATLHTHGKGDLSKWDSTDQLSRWRQVFQAMVATLSPCLTPSLLSAKAQSLALSCTSAYVDLTTGPSTVLVTTTCRTIIL